MASKSEQKWTYDIYLDDDCLFDGEQANEVFPSESEARYDASTWVEQAFTDFYGRDVDDFVIEYYQVDVA